MSPLLDVQRRAREVGRIRIGVQVVGKNGKLRPSKLTGFRFTGPSERGIRAVAGLFGGEPRPWTEGPTSGLWEVLTTATELPVAVPPGDAALSQHYELWSGGGCQRRCDGITEQLRGTDCLCPSDQQERAAAAADGNACRPTTRVNLIIPDLPDVGVWRLESHGWYAAMELGGTAELLASARGAGVIVPAMLRLEQRSIIRPGQQRRDFAVPVLEILATLRELGAARAGSLDSQLPPAPPAAGALAAAPPPPVGLDLATAQAVAQYAAAATEREQVVEAGRLARRRGWMGDLVEHEGAHEPLEQLLFARLEFFDAPGGAG